MNIFFLDSDPEKAAAMLCDKHLSKMQLETAQLLSTLAWAACPDIAPDFAYKPTHGGHPCAIWLTQSTANVKWLVMHALGMNAEWIARGHAKHKSFAVSMNCALALADSTIIPDRQLTLVPLCMPDDIWTQFSSTKHADIETAVDAYREYYCVYKAYMAKWPVGRQPGWFINKALANVLH